MSIDALPLDDLYRGLNEAPELRAEADVSGDGSLMFGHFAVFDTWTEVDSWYEGNFLERIAKGAFKKTMRERRSQIKVQYDHGFDMNVGDSLLGPIDDLREDDQGAYYEVPLLDTDYNRDRVLPMLQGRLMSGEKRGSLLGASFRFRVTKEDINRTPKPSDSNPNSLPERTIREVSLYEFGPVVFPQYPEATAGARSCRSLTDHYIARRLERQGRTDVAARSLARIGAAPDGTPSEQTDEPTRSHSEGNTLARHRRRVSVYQLAR